MSDTIRSRRRGPLPRDRSLRSTAALVLAALAGLWTSAASAEVLLFSANTNLRQIFRGTVGFVDLNGNTAGGMTLTFSTAQANQRVVIFFNATCAVTLNEANPVIARVAILVDPAGSDAESSAPPTNSPDEMFCSHWGSNISATIVASVRPAVAGSHKVRVRVTPSAPDPSTAGVLLAAISLTVIR
jgi:hypothetical protein